MFRATRSLVGLGWPASRFGNSRSYLQRPLAIEIARSSSTKSGPPPPKPSIDREHERKLAHETLKPTPSEVTIDSTTRVGWEKKKASSSSAQDSEPAFGESLQHDLGIVKDTFRLKSVPKESQVLGLAGSLPYVATSASTLYLGWDLSKELPTGNSFYDAIIINHDTAKYLLDFIEPLQLGYGAVIISFLGAIHWGLEYAEKTPAPQRTRFRYGMGVVASIVAWPTVLMSLEYGLIVQFVAFVALYFADARATNRGWAPAWYGTYRFLLTAIVGFAIFISLVGRSQMERSEQLSKQYIRSHLNSPGLADRDTNWAKLEAEEKAKVKKEEKRKERIAKQEKAKKSQDKTKQNESPARKDGKRDGDKRNDDNEAEEDDNKTKDSKDGEKKESNDGEKESDNGEKKESDDGDDGEEKESDDGEEKKSNNSEKKESDDEEKKRDGGADKSKDEKDSNDQENNNKKKKEGGDGKKNSKDKAA